MRFEFCRAVPAPHPGTSGAQSLYCTVMNAGSFYNPEFLGKVQTQDFPRRLGYRSVMTFSMSTVTGRNVVTATARIFVFYLVAVSWPEVQETLKHSGIRTSDPTASHRPCLLPQRQQD